MKMNDYQLLAMRKCFESILRADKGNAYLWMKVQAVNSSFRRRDRIIAIYKGLEKVVPKT